MHFVGILPPPIDSALGKPCGSNQKPINENASKLAVPLSTLPDGFPQGEAAGVGR